MESLDLYQAVGGREACRQLSESFYARVARDPVLRPLFPGKSLRCAIEAFAAFLAQFLGGPAEDAQQRWWLSLRESHLRFKIGPQEREAWLKNMIAALDEAALEEPVRLALRALFEQSSAYVMNRGQRPGEAPGPLDSTNDTIHREIARRWDEQRMLDDLLAAIRQGDAERAIGLARSAVLEPRFARDRSVLAHVLAFMMGSGDDNLLEFAEREVKADPALAHVPGRYGRTLLHEASAQGNERVVELLLRLGADPNVRTSGGHTPLYCVANECRVADGDRVIRLLVRAGADVNARSGSKQCTALHMAARRGNAGLAAALMDCGADIHARDKAGVTAVQRAKNCRKSTVAALLILPASD